MEAFSMNLALAFLCVFDFCIYLFIQFWLAPLIFSLHFDLLFNFLYLFHYTSFTFDPIFVEVYLYSHLVAFLKIYCESPSFTFIRQAFLDLFFKVYQLWKYSEALASVYLTAIYYLILVLLSAVIYGWDYPQNLGDVQEDKDYAL